MREPCAFYGIGALALGSRNASASVRSRSCDTRGRLRAGDETLMGIDTVIVVRSSVLAEKSTSLAVLRPLEDGALVTLSLPYRDLEADARLASYVLRRELGDAAVEAVDDPRGLFLYPDVAVPRGETLADVVRELTEVGGGMWIAPMSTAAVAAYEAEMIAELPTRVAEVLDQVRVFQELAAADASGDADAILAAEAKLSPEIRTQREAFREAVRKK